MYACDCQLIKCTCYMYVSAVDMHTTFRVVYIYLRLLYSIMRDGTSLTSSVPSVPLSSFHKYAEKPVYKPTTTLDVAVPHGMNRIAELKRDIAWIGRNPCSASSLGMISAIRFDNTYKYARKL